MNKAISFIIVPILLASCLTSPEFNRDNPRDLNTGIPYVRDLSYVINQNGILVNWFDGSLENDEIIVTQKIYDYSSDLPDSLIKVNTFEEDRTFFQDVSNDFGYPYFLIVKSNILNDSGNIKSTFSDTLNIDAGRLELLGQSAVNDRLNVSLRNIPTKFVEGMFYEVNTGGGWELIEESATTRTGYSFITTGYSGEVSFRISYKIKTFNERFTKGNSIIVTENF